MKTKCFLIAFSCCMMLLACNRGVNVPCTDPTNIHFAFRSYPIGDIDTLVISNYVPGGNFAQKIRDINFYLGVNGNYAMLGDTVVLQYNDYSLQITPGQNDWQIYIPARNKTVRISEISTRQTSQVCGGGFFNTRPGCVCTNPMASYKRDGQVIMPVTGYQFLLLAN